ncbi:MULTISPECIES: hypothetical protein [unclassified Oceanispirochaeta]|uniref:hypothetical protein n=1 Tax=unclassified Oceanispirochaeta TaxID=2635722 RepID=UPI000E08E6AF|nr:MULTISPECIES: hypothetical protein [unclassified Oceanispirochaeta]MBF9014128.1 hypothetical protein [Oceanispirochaeta sp. M2]NPD70619.1 hypothetical protein [Oceanispirochaeta sp. M1]RDG34384.1 hypothetical protein DV872_00785 [Oceanispirochaeta sp. M1]
MDSVEASRPPKCIPEIEALARGEKIDESGILTLCAYVDSREDCADFRMATLIRILYQFRDLLSEETLAVMKKSFLAFKYWMDEPGDDSMCLWSENHQILFASCEYLAGQFYPEEIFSNNGMTGLERVEHSGARVLKWMSDRWDWGIIEWHSNVYYEEDLPALCNLIDFTADEEIVRKTTLVMDLFLTDIAMHSWKGCFNVSSGRCYERQKMSPMGADTLQVTESIWGFGNIKEYDYSTLSAHFLLMQNYEVPTVIKQIGQDHSPAEIRTSNGINLAEMKSLGFDMKSRDTVIYQWAMEAFSNPESVMGTMTLYKDWKMEKNRFLRGLDVLANPVLRKSGILPFISKTLNPVFNGVAIQRANTYTFRTENYMMSTACAYHPGDYGDQHHIWTATLSKDINVFTTHPAVLSFGDDELLSLSPNNWVGNGRNPHSVQYKNVGMSLYELPKKKGFMEKHLHHFTHAWFPSDLFDEAFLKGHRALGRIGNTYCALIGASDLKRADNNPSELIQEGRSTWWVCILGSSNEDGSFDEFKAKISAVKPEYYNQNLIFNYGNSEYDLKWKGSFRIDGKDQSLDFQRLESPWGKVQRKPKKIKLECGESSLNLNFKEMTKKEF